MIGSRIGMTVLLGLSTIVFTWLVGVPIGIYSATHQYKLSDHFWTFVGFIGLSTPNFVLALVMMYLSFVWFDFIPSGLFSQEFANAPWSIPKLLDFLAHLWLPVVILGTAGTAGIIRVMRGNLLDVLGEDYIQTARAKGVRESVVIYKHAVRNAIHPLIMSLGEVLKNVVSGATIVAIVLSLPTVGPLLFEALMSQDMYLAGTLIMFQSFFLVIGYLLADILLAAVDPRVTYT
jgi:peptide/nickel transport system permease protein